MYEIGGRLIAMRQVSRRRDWGLTGALIALFGCISLSAHAMGADMEKHPAAHSPKEVLLVVNAESPVSIAVGNFYAQKRGIGNMVTIHCPDSAVSQAHETILLAEYERAIGDPVRAYLKEHRAINFIVLTKGVPIRVRGGVTGSRDENQPGAPLNASVDSYLASIDYTVGGPKGLAPAVKISIHGSGASGYGLLNRYWKASTPFTHAKFGGYLVTRLDGYTQADAEALVTRSLAAESTGITTGKVLLDVQPGFGTADVAAQPEAVTGTISDESQYGTWNADMVKAAGILKERGVAFELDMGEAFVGDRAGLLAYFSWGSNDQHYTEKAYESLTFAPGSISDTAVSTSARTFLPTTGGQSLITDLIAHGVTGVKGYTDEPLLQAVASASVTLDRYTARFNLAESFYAGSRFVGWEDVVIGDPLCLAPAALRGRGAR
jgi:uncharacterized protein (TIGR03790 family)